MTTIRIVPLPRAPMAAPLGDVARLIWTVSRDALDQAARAAPGDPLCSAAFGLAFIEEVARLDGPRRPASLTRMAAGSARAIRARAGLPDTPPIVA